MASTMTLWLSNDRSLHLTRVASLLFLLGNCVRSVDAFVIGAVVQPSNALLQLSSASSQQSAAHTATIASPLAEHGDWQAFFDEDRYCLVYYFNTVTGTSQWEPPENFPIPAVRHATTKPTSTTSISISGIQQHVNQKKREREERRVLSAQKAQEKKEEQPSAFQWMISGAFQAASDLIEKQQEAAKQNRPKKESKPWWSFLVDSDVKDDTASPLGTREVIGHAQQPEPISVELQQEGKKAPFWSRFFNSAEDDQQNGAHTDSPFYSTHHQQDRVPTRTTQRSMRTLQQQHTEWLKFMSDNESNPTIPLIPPSEREAKLQQKLYADSLARQENLRRNYKAVQEHRSRTFSLSALKRDNPEAKEWYQYLGE